LAKNPKWLVDSKYIKPLVTTQEDIERLLGGKGTIYNHKDDSYFYLAEYENDYGYWGIQYSTGKCSEKKVEGFDVEKGVVLRARFRVEKRFKFSSLKLNIADFEIYPESDTSNVFYTNYEEGVSYTKGRRDLLGSIEIFPAKKYHNLACSNK
jgi:hypothetical protein